MLGDLAELITSKYQGDLNNMLKATNSSPAKIRKALKEIKGIGDVGVDIFFDTVQGVWPVLAPFLDPRSVKVVGEIGGLVEKEDEGVVQELWQCVGRDPVEMCRLAGALTRVRLENRAGEFK